MPELPEIVCRSREMNELLRGRTIVRVEVRQPKCLNVSVAAFAEAFEGATIGRTTVRGKWLVTETTGGALLINLGMGGELLFVDRDDLPEKWRVRFDLDGDKTLSVNFWWFGSTHLVPSGKLESEGPLTRLGPNALDIELTAFRRLLGGRRGRIKSFLLDQKNVAGIGNAYVHDILFSAGLHPLRTIPTLSEAEIAELHRAIRAELKRSIKKGSASYEVGLLGQRGGFGASDLRVGYREGEPCPQCGACVEKVKTGSTSSYVCPRCQPLDPGEANEESFEAVSHET